MTITSFVIISSKYKTDDSRSTSDFTYSIGQSLEVSAVAIKSVSIPHLQYNINQYNNKLALYYGEGVPVLTSITLPQGQYDMTTFLSALQDLIRSSIGDNEKTVTQDAFSKRLVISGGSVPLKISTDQTTSPLAKIIGFGDTEEETYPAVISNSITAPFLPNLAGIKNYYLSSRVLSQGYNGIFKNGQQIPLVMNIPITVPYGVVQHYDPQDIQLNLKKFSRKNNVQWIDIKILNEDLDVVDLNGGDIEIVLKIYTTDNPLSEK